jgi:hypothetical protein
VGLRYQDKVNRKTRSTSTRARLPLFKFSVDTVRPPAAVHAMLCDTAGLGRPLRRVTTSWFLKCRMFFFHPSKPGTTSPALVLFTSLFKFLWWLSPI